MSTLFRNKILTGIVILLLAANITTIILFWVEMRKVHPPPFQQPSEFIIKELSLDEQQQQLYKAMIKQHREQSKLIREQVRISKDSFFDLLAHENRSDPVKNNIADKIASLNRQLDLLTFDHFKEVRKICSPGQQQKFDRIIKGVLRMMSAQPPDGKRPPGPGMEGPPPPGN